jgi:hypothetical protein
MQPSFETIKQELARLHSFTSEIGKAQEITTQVQAAAAAVIEAAESIDQRQRELLEQLQTEHLRNTKDQTAIVRTAALQQTKESEELLHKELASLHQGAELVIKALQQVVEEQPRILSTIRTHHEQNIGSQTDLLRETISESAVKLNNQFSGQIDQLQQVKQDFSFALGKQLDGFTAVTDRLQVISASLTAFRDSMNAARFSDRLESIDSQQGTIQARLSKLNELETQNQNLATKLTSLKTQNTLILVLVGISVVVSVALRFL